MSVFHNDLDFLHQSFDGLVNGIVDYFKDSKVYTSIEEAWDKAFALDESHGWSEDGTCLITEFTEYHFSDFEERYVKK